MIPTSNRPPDFSIWRSTCSSNTVLLLKRFFSTAPRPIPTAQIHLLFLIQVPPGASHILPSTFNSAKRFIWQKNKSNYILLPRNVHWRLWFKLSFGWSDLIAISQLLQNSYENRKAKREKEKKKEIPRYNEKEINRVYGVSIYIEAIGASRIGKIILCAYLIERSILFT